MAKILNIVESAYRATLEEQDDTALWFTHMMAAKAGADLALLLRGNAVNYLSKAQRVGHFQIGQAELGNPPKLAEDVEAMLKSNIPVYYVEEDAGERGLEKSELIAGVKPVSKSGLAKLVAGYDRVFHW